MKQLLAVLFLGLSLAPAARAQVTGANAVYIGGTVPNLKAGSIGTIDLTLAKEMIFQSGEMRAEFPYAGIQSYEYSRKLARRIGVIPTIAVVAVVKHRQRRHFITISFKDPQGTVQLAVLEVAKQMPSILLPVLAARSPQSSSKIKKGHEHLLFH